MHAALSLLRACKLDLTARCYFMVFPSSSYFQTSLRFMIMVPSRSDVPLQALAIGLFHSPFLHITLHQIYLSGIVPTVVAASVHVSERTPGVLRQRKGESRTLTNNVDRILVNHPRRRRLELGGSPCVLSPGTTVKGSLISPWVIWKHMPA